MHYTAHLDAFSGLRAFGSPAACPHCHALLVAPLRSEFVASGGICHHWLCEECGRVSRTAISFDMPANAEDRRSSYPD